MQQKITLKIAGNSYPITIEAQKEEMYRMAEKRVNELVIEMQKQRVKRYDTQDHLAIAAFTLALEGINTQRERSLDNEQIQTLIDMETTIDTYLNERKE